MLNPFQQNTIQKALEIWQSQPIFLDTETTGLHNSAEIIEISIIDSDGNVLFESLIKPRLSIPLDAVLIHGITNADVQDAPTWLHIWPQVESILLNRLVGVYNVEFDLRMMQQSHRANGLPWRLPPTKFFCIMRLYAEYGGYMKWQSLEDAGRQLGIPLPNSHRARADTLLAREVFERIAGW